MRLKTIVAVLFPFTLSAQATTHQELEQAFGEKVRSYLVHDEQALDMNLVKELRQHGKIALDWLRSAYKTGDYYSHEGYKKGAHDLLLIDKVSGQKDALYSGLFWHTNLEEAKALAKKENKMVLSLCMLGDFTEDLSCANSRFFRIFLYTDGAVNMELRNKYVLHVQSVINVPKITIEYPDGTKQVQTITGNSMHLAMTPGGEILDALPGLYGPRYFAQWLKEVAQDGGKEPYHTKYARDLDSLAKATAHLGLLDTALVRISSRLPRPVSEAFIASRASVSKARIEAPVFSRIDRPLYTSPRTLKGLSEPPSDPDMELLNQLAVLGFKQEDVNPVNSLGARIPKLMSLKKAYSAEALLAAEQQMNTQLTVENIRNEVLLHSKILDWLQQPEMRTNHQLFIGTAYRELFNTPLDDKKMGMYDPTLFYGITNDGF